MYVYVYVFIVLFPTNSASLKPISMNFRLQVLHCSYLHRWIGGKKNSTSIISHAHFIISPLFSPLFSFSFHSTPLHSTSLLTSPLLYCPFLSIPLHSTPLLYSPFLSSPLILSFTFHSALTLISSPLISFPFFYFLLMTVWWICGIVLLYSIRCVWSEEL